MRHKLGVGDAARSRGKEDTKMRTEADKRTPLGDKAERDLRMMGKEKKEKWRVLMWVGRLPMKGRSRSLHLMWESR